jgi:hypothetical protein
VANLDKFGVKLNSFRSVSDSITICFSLDVCLSSVGEKGRLLVVLFDSLGVKVDCAGVVTRLKGLVALVLELDGVHVVKSKGSSSGRHRNRSKVKGGGGVVCLVVLRRAQYQPLRSVAKRERLGFGVCRSRISSWNAAEARRTPNKARFHNARKCKEVLDRG